MEDIVKVKADTIVDAVELINENTVSNTSNYMDHNIVDGTLVADPKLMTPRKPRPFVREYNKIGRNDLCPCGSGKKYKDCCLKEGTYEGLREISNEELYNVKNSKITLASLKKTA